MCLPFEDLAERSLAKGEYLGYEWEVTRNRYAVRCGYIRVLPGHPWFEADRDSVVCNVHGGLTFSEHGKECPTHGPAAEWWIGFDCGHGMDASDPSLIRPGDVDLGGGAIFEYGEVRTQEYVEEQCRLLIEQAVRAAA